MKSYFEALDRWSLRARLLVIAGLSALVIPGVLSLPDAFLFFLGLGMGVSAIAGYWLGARWFLVPLVAMGVEIAIAIPLTLLNPDGETPVSVVLEAPFWTGMPALVGAIVGGAMRALVQRRLPPAEGAAK